MTARRDHDGDATVIGPAAHGSDMDIQPAGGLPYRKPFF